MKFLDSEKRYEAYQLFKQYADSKENLYSWSLATERVAAVYGLDYANDACNVYRYAEHQLVNFPSLSYQWHRGDPDFCSAWITGEPGYWGSGGSVDEAVGSVLRAHPERFQIVDGDK